MKTHRTPLVLSLLAVLAVAPRPAAARDFAAPALPGDRAAPGLMVEEPPRYGVFYDDPEPSFYTGFAPRIDDPTRLHIHLGRGNQLRVTAVLSDETLRDYARDLAERERVYRTLVATRRIELTQNRAFEAFAQRLLEVQLARVVAEEAAQPPATVRDRNLDLLAQLNPGRVFRIAIPVTALVQRWVAELTPADRIRMDDARRLELANLLLPTRLWLAALPAGVGGAIDDLVRRASVCVADGSALAALTAPYAALLTRVADGRYPVENGVVRFAEFTAIYPVGTVAAYTTWHGRRIPAYPTPGRRALTTHQRTLVADHIPIDDSYSYSPWLPYMHVTPTMHNAIHTPWWKMGPEDAKFLPAAWRDVTSGSRDGQPFRKLWLLSRGPMSHGCTHLNTGHIAELRQMLPADGDQLYDVDVFLTRSEDYDVFDIDGDLVPEVMGVRYFIAYSLINGKPDRLRVKNERRAFYDWLYAGDLHYDGDQGVFSDVRDGRFVGRDAREGRSYGRVLLREADYQPETVQFYRMVDIPFARELRKVGVHHPASALFADRGVPRSTTLRADSARR
jgi:hypothetical protein